jgi:Protein of unknown function (DUF3088)
MPRDTLFLLPPGFAANGQREFCPECAELWGVLSWFPALKETLDIVYVGIEHPRAPITAYLPSARLIARHFAALHGTPVPRGH